MRGGGAAHDTTVTMSPVQDCPTRRHHGFGGWHLAFCFPVGTYLSFRLGAGVIGRISVLCVCVCVCVPITKCVCLCVCLYRAKYGVWGGGGGALGVL